MSFEAIVQEHYQSLFRFALSLARVESDAWDLTQHTFYVWATKGHQIRDSAKIQSWLFTTLHRAFLTAHKRQAKFSDEPPDELLLQVPDPSPAPSEEPNHLRVLPALSRVDPLYRSAVALYYLNGHSYNEITAILGIPLGTVKSRIARGIAQLRDLLVVPENGFPSPRPKRSSANLLGERHRATRALHSASRKWNQPLTRMVGAP